MSERKTVMKKILFSLKRYSLLVIVVTAVLGVLLVAFPGQMLSYTAYFLGGGIIICGAAAVISYLVKKESKLALVLGIIAVVFGVVICACHRQIMSAMIFIMGIFLLAGGVFDLVNSIAVAVAKHRSWLVTVIMSIVSIVVGILSIVNPFEIQNKVVVFIGCGLLLFAVLECVTYFQIRKINENISAKEEKFGTEDSAKEVDFEDAD